MVHLKPHELVIWSHRGETKRSLPTGCAVSIRSTTVFSDFTQMPGSEPWHLLVNGGAASRVPPYGPLQEGMMSTCGPYVWLTLSMKADDPKAWLREAAEIAQNEGNWRPPRWDVDRGVTFVATGPTNRQLVMTCDEGDGTVKLMVRRR